MYRSLLGATLAVLIAAPAFAQSDQGGPGPRAPKTRDEVKQQAAARFAEMDINHDGVVTRDEAIAYAKGRRTAMRDKAFARLDADHNGSISHDEFMAPPGHGAGKKRGGGGMAAMMFDRMDTNHDGKITQDEATTGALAMFDRMDANHDGVLQPEEMRARWHRGPDRAGGRGGDALPPPAQGN